MQPPTDQPIQQPRSTGMDKFEMGAIFVSLAAAIGGAVMQQAALAALPLSFTAALSFANRRRLMETMAQSQQQAQAQVVAIEQRQQKAMTQMQQDLEGKLTALSEQLTSQTSQLQATQTTFSQQLETLEAKGTDVASLLEKLREIDRFTQAIRTNPSAANLYFKRGVVRQSLIRTEDKMLAIDDFTQAIELDAAFADAYFQRGQLRAECSEKRLAGEDLRLAAKCYFDRGEMERYDEAKRLSEQIYEKFEQRQEANEGRLRASDLFA